MSRTCFGHVSCHPNHVGGVTRSPDEFHYFHAVISTSSFFRAQCFILILFCFCFKTWMRRPSFQDFDESSSFTQLRRTAANAPNGAYTETRLKKFNVANNGPTHPSAQLTQFKHEAEHSVCRTGIRGQKERSDPHGVDHAAAKNALYTPLGG